VFVGGRGCGCGGCSAGAGVCGTYLSWSATAPGQSTRRVDATADRPGGLASSAACTHALYILANAARQSMS
jgi:hypothetical protein